LSEYTNWDKVVTEAVSLFGLRQTIIAL